MTISNYTADEVVQLGLNMFAGLPAYLAGSSVAAQFWGKPPGNDLDVFVAAEGRRLTGRSGDDQRIGTLLDMPVHQAFQTGEVDCSVGRHGRDQGDEAAAEHGIDVIDHVAQGL